MQDLVVQKPKLLNLIDGTSRDDRDPAPVRQFLQRLTRFRMHECLRRIRHHRRESAVEVEGQQRRLRGRFEGLLESVEMLRARFPSVHVPTLS